jgi:rhodanese-related sulfurtransferase/rubrerythrin
MGLLDYIKPVTTITADEARDKIKGISPDEYCLLDVRQPREYEEMHLPGAVLIPIGQLSNRIGELDPEKMTIVYCAIGGRSRAGAAILGSGGFREVYNLKGGTKAWNGISVAGPPDMGMARFQDLDRVEDILMLAWSMEEGTRRFYEKMEEMTTDADAANLFAKMKKAEVMHQRLIDKLFYEITGQSPGAEPPAYRSHPAGSDEEQLMEGQMMVNEVVSWAKDRTVEDVLEYCMGLEAIAYDLYFRLKGVYDEPEDVKTAYTSLAKEEKQHLDTFARLFEKKLD